MKLLVQLVSLFLVLVVHHAAEASASDSSSLRATAAADAAARRRLGDTATDDIVVLGTVCSQTALDTVGELEIDVESTGEMKVKYKSKVCPDSVYTIWIVATPPDESCKVVGKYAGFFTGSADSGSTTVQIEEETTYGAGTYEDDLAILRSNNCDDSVDPKTWKFSFPLKYHGTVTQWNDAGTDSQWIDTPNVGDSNVCSMGCPTHQKPEVSL